MRRFLAVALPILVMLVVLYVIGSAGSARHAKSASPRLLPPAQQALTTTSRSITAPQETTPPPLRTAPPTSTDSQTTTVITAKRTDCRWRRYRDGAIGTAPSCAPGKLDPAVTGNTAQTVCSGAWVTAASRRQPPPSTLDRLLIEYQLPGNPVTLRPRPRHSRRGRRQPDERGEPLPAAAKRLRRPVDADGGRKPAPRRDLLAQDHGHPGGQDAQRATGYRKDCRIVTSFSRRLFAGVRDHRSAALGILLAAVALGGCGTSTSSEVNQAVGDAAHAAQAVTQLSQKAMRSWCPAAVAGDGRPLSQAQARDCVRQAWNGWLGELKRNGYDPRKVARGQ